MCGRAQGAPETYKDPARPHRACNLFSSGKKTFHIDVDVDSFIDTNSLSTYTHTMSVDNLTMLHTAAFTPFHTLQERPKLGMMLPDPTQRQTGSSPQAQCAVSPASSTTSQGFYDHRPQLQHSQSFSLPPIRELLGETPAPVGSLPVPSRAASASAASSVAQPIPSPRPIPSLHQMPSPQYQPYHMNSITPPPPPQAQTQCQGPLGRSSSLPNYLTHYGGRVPSPSYQQHQTSVPSSQYPTSHPMNMANMMPTPESRSETASPVHGEMLSLPSLYSEVNKEAKLSSRKKRQNLPRQTTLILLSWLSEHLDRPYPNSREKYELLMKTRLTIQQLDNWFINARRRKINELRKLKESDQSIALMF